MLGSFGTRCRIRLNHQHGLLTRCGLIAGWQAQHRPQNLHCKLRGKITNEVKLILIRQRLNHRTGNLTNRTREALEIATHKRVLNQSPQPIVARGIGRAQRITRAIGQFSHQITLCRGERLPVV